MHAPTHAVLESFQAFVPGRSAVRPIIIERSSAEVTDGSYSGKYPEAPLPVSTPLYCRSGWELAKGDVNSGNAMAYPAFILHDRDREFHL